MYDLAQGNGSEVRRLYLQRFSNRRLPSHPTFASVDGRLRETGSFAISNSCTGHSRSVRSPEKEEYVLNRFQETPSTSTPAVAAEISLSPTTVWCVLREERIQPFRLQRVQCLKDDDYSHRLHFVRWMLQSVTNNSSFLTQYYLRTRPRLSEKVYSTLTMISSGLGAIPTELPHLNTKRDFRQRVGWYLW